VMRVVMSSRAETSLIVSTVYAEQEPQEHAKQRGGTFLGERRLPACGHIRPLRRMQYSIVMSFPRQGAADYRPGSPCYPIDIMT
jgi:hypothetical protein